MEGRSSEVDFASRVRLAAQHEHFRPHDDRYFGIVTLVERGGRARSVKVDDLKAATLRAAVLNNADTDSKLMTDERHTYRSGGASRDTAA
jgi:hypothetical protein